jgi:V8-like Glu-specific endopeptidase
MVIQSTGEGAMGAWFDDLPLDFTRTDTRAAEQALITGYDNAFSVLNLVKNVGLAAASLNMAMPVKFLMRDVLSQARLANRLTVLLGEVFADPSQAAIHGVLRPTIAGHEAEITEAVRNRQPSLERLSLLPPTAEVWGAAEATPRPLATPGLEKIVNDAAGFADVGVFRRRLAEAEVRTARIDVGGRANGTGFLVGDQLLLTNWHVVSTVAAGAVALFDHSVLNPTTGRAVPFAADWLVARSEHDTIPSELGATGPPVGTWDFALVRLAEPAGAQAIGPDPAAAAVDKRGHYRLDGTDYSYDEREPLLVVGHPDGRPIQLSYAAPSGATPTEHGNRVRYQTNTEGGSSGSPVFNRDFRVVALHHAGGPTTASAFAVADGQFNQGVPIAGVVAELKKQLGGRPELTELGLG